MEEEKLKQIRESREEFPLGWNNICEYAEKRCKTAPEDKNYFMEHCVNNGKRCCIKSLEATKRLGIKRDL